MWSVVSVLKHMQFFVVQVEPGFLGDCPPVTLFLHQTQRNLRFLSWNLTFYS